MFSTALSAHVIAGSLSTWMIHCPNPFSIKTFFNCANWCRVAPCLLVGIARQSPVAVSTQLSIECTFLSDGLLGVVQLSWNVCLLTEFLHVAHSEASYICWWLPRVDCVVQPPVSHWVCGTQARPVKQYVDVIQSQGNPINSDCTLPDEQTCMMTVCPNDKHWPT
eukprot:5637442-Amphidinium_carterae.2